MDSEKAERFETLGTVSSVTDVGTFPTVFPVHVSYWIARCKECGAIVTFSDRELHLSWHSVVTEAFLK